MALASIVTYVLCITDKFQMYSCFELEFEREFVKYQAGTLNSSAIIVTFASLVTPICAFGNLATDGLHILAVRMTDSLK